MVGVQVAIVVAVAVPIIKLDWEKLDKPWLGAVQSVITEAWMRSSSNWICCGVMHPRRCMPGAHWLLAKLFI